MNMRSSYPPVIAGAKGGKSGKGGGSGGTEAPNSLKSRQIARIIDLLSEGPIVGPANGIQSIYFDGVPLQAANGSFNFNAWTVAGNTGTPAQPVLDGNQAQQAETSVGLQVKTINPIVRTVTNGDVDRVRVTVSVPALQVTDKKNGNISGTSVVFDVHIQSNGGGYAHVARHEITGKTNTRYQRALVFTLFGSPPWDIRLSRVTADSTTLELQNDLYWDSYTEIIDSKVNYTLSACVSITIDAEQFSAIPRRTYDLKGLYLRVPNNYNPDTGAYAGVWDGTFKMAWSNNPAWVYMDMVVNSRYGLGNFVSLAQIDKWALYKISQWCDGGVPDGRGGYERRFVCNAVISSQQEAFDLINSLASVFRGSVYWAGGMMVPVADMPKDPVGLYTNANVIDGVFSYAGADIRARHNQVMVKWNDPANLGESRVSIVEDQQAISRYGIQRTEVIAIGCTSESQAIRTGKWTLFSDTYEAETVNFTAGLDTAWARPGDVIQIADYLIAGQKTAGRCAAGSTTSIVYLDAPIHMGAVIGALYISCNIGEGLIETKQVGLVDVDANGQYRCEVVSPFSQPPLADTVFVLNAPGHLEPSLWRVITARETDDDTYEVTALRQRPDKWDFIERNIALQTPDITDIGSIPPVTDLNAKDYLVALSSISVGVRMLISWQSLAPSFDVAWRPENGNWIRVRTDQTAHDVDVEEGVYEIWVTPINSLGRRGVTTKIKYTVVGRLAPPENVKNFRIQVVQGVAMFQWAPATDIDVIIGGAFEMRYSPRETGATWVSSNTVLTSIPGTATTVELPYRSGTYLIKARDIVGLFSSAAAVVVTSAPDINYRPYVRICEQPEWLGNKVNTEVQEPQDWLVLGTTGGYWDEQTDPIDDWPTVDVLPVSDEDGPLPYNGQYYFFHSLDMGDEFAVRLSVDMLAFPFVEADAFIDERPGTVDEWQNWDASSEDGAGMVTVRVRQTNDDPLSPTAVWTPWQQFIAGEYVGRGFQFRADLGAPAGQNIAIEELCILADITAKQDHGADVVWTPSVMDIEFEVKFFTVPALSIAIQEGVVGDTFRITNKTRTGFRLELISESGAIITGARTFDWTASGY